MYVLVGVCVCVGVGVGVPSLVHSLQITCFVLFIVGWSILATAPIVSHTGRYTHHKHTHSLTLLFPRPLLEHNVREVLQSKPSVSQWSTPL